MFAFIFRADNEILDFLRKNLKTRAVLIFNLAHVDERVMGGRKGTEFKWRSVDKFTLIFAE